MSTVQIVPAGLAGSVILAVASHPISSARCKTREILKARVSAELRVYADAIAVLQEQAIAALSALQDTAGCFKKAHDLADRAKLAYQVSRQLLDKHVADHGCG